jgi:hypothetical protein
MDPLVSLCIGLPPVWRIASVASGGPGLSLAPSTALGTLRLIGLLLRPVQFELHPLHLHCKAGQSVSEHVLIGASVAMVVPGASMAVVVLGASMAVVVLGASMAVVLLGASMAVVGLEASMAVVLIGNAV